MNHYQLFSKRLDILLRKFMAFGKPIVRIHRKIGRNKPCPCGSGVKYKKCHYSEDYQKGNV